MTELRQKINNIVEEKNTKVVPENIRAGRTMFDVEGTFSSDANATAEDIAMNKTAYVNGEKITGTLLEPSMSSISTDNIIDTGSRVDIEGKMPTDYLFRKNSSITYNIKYSSLANAIGLTSEKIMKGNTVIGVSGNATSDATATASDILKDKTAYVNGMKIVGTYEGTNEPEFVLPEELIGIEYIQGSDSAPIFNTGYRHKSNTNVEAQFMQITNSSVYWVNVFGARNINYLSSAFTFFSKFSPYSDGINRFAFCRTGSEVYDSGIFDEKVTVITNGLSATFTNGTITKTLTTTGKLDDGVNDFLLLGINAGGPNEVSQGSNSTAYTRLYYLKIFEDEALVHYYVPCKTEDGYAGFYDFIDKKLITVPINQVVCGPDSNANNNANILPDAAYSTVFEAKKFINKIETLNLQGFDSMYQAFYTFYNLESIKELKNTNGIVNWREAFAYCEKLIELPDTLDTSEATTMYETFRNCKKIKKIPIMNTSKVTNFYNTFYSCESLEEISNIDASKATTLSDTFCNCKSLKRILNLNTSNVQVLDRTFGYCTSLQEVPALDSSNMYNINNAFLNCNSLTTFGGLIDLGKSFRATSANNSACTFRLDSSNNLTHESLMNVINNLYDLNLTYNVANGGTLYTQQLILGSTNKAKLTAEEIAIATAKGWTVS